MTNAKSRQRPRNGFYEFLPLLMLAFGVAGFMMMGALKPKPKETPAKDRLGGEFDKKSPLSRTFLQKA